MCVIVQTNGSMKTILTAGHRYLHRLLRLSGVNSQKMLNQVTTDEHSLYKRSSSYRHDLSAAAHGVQHRLEA
jgi:hypothetical protein